MVFLMEKLESEIYKALTHPIRRRILSFLHETVYASFDEILKNVFLANHGKLGFHMRSLKGLVEYEDSMKKYTLTDRGKLLVELMSDAHFLIARQRLVLEYEPIRYIRHLRLGDHAVLFYELEEIKRMIAFSFLLAGLIKGFAVLYITSESKLDLERMELLKYGVDFDLFSKGAFSLMSSEEWYLRKGKASSETIIENWKDVVSEKRKVGFEGIYVAGDMEAFFENSKIQELLRYEKTIGKQNSLNLCALCLYLTSRLNEELFIQLNKYHSHSIFNGIVLRTDLDKQPKTARFSPIP